VSLKQSHNRNLAFKASAFSFPFSFVHVAGLAADERFVYFDVPALLYSQSAA